MDPYQWTMQISKLAVIPLDNTQGLTGGRVELHCINSQYISYTVELVRAWHLPTYHRLLSSLPRQPMRTMGGTQSDIDDYTAIGRELAPAPKDLSGRLRRSAPAQRWVPAMRTDRLQSETREISR